MHYLFGFGQLYQKVFEVSVETAGELVFNVSVIEFLEDLQDEMPKTKQRLSVSK